MTATQKVILILTGMVCVSVVILYIVSAVLPNLLETRESAAKAPPAQGYADCVLKTFSHLEHTNKVRYIDVSASIQKLMTLGPKSLSEEEQVRVQQTLASEAQPLALAQCAEAARGHPLVLLVGVDTQRRRKDIQVSTVGSPPAECKTDETGTCLLSIVGLAPTSKLHLKAHSVNLIARTQTFDYVALTGGLVKLDLASQDHRLLTIQAKLRSEAFPGWISVSLPNSASSSEITSEECFEAADWDSPKCRTVRADDFGRGSFVHTGTIDSIVVDLAYRSRTSSMTVPVVDGRAEVNWVGRFNSLPSTDAPKAATSPCGSRTKLERVLDVVPWSRSENIEVSIRVDSDGRLTAEAGIPAPVKGFLEAKRVRVDPACVPQIHEFSYHTKADDP